MSFHITNKIIKKEWTDYNNHMNVAYYVLVFDEAWEVMLQKFQMGENSAKTTGKSTMIVESHMTYNQELKLNDEVEINLVYFDHDKKRLQYKIEMVHKEKKFLASTIEVLALHVDLNNRKVIEFDKEKSLLMDEYIEKNKSLFKNEDLKFTAKLKK